MARMESTMIELGSKAPDFILPDTVSGKNFSLDEVKAEKGLLVAFICNHCPYVIHICELFATTANLFPDKGISTVAISPNDVDNYPQDGPEKMKELAGKYGFGFPYLYDGFTGYGKGLRCSLYAGFLSF